MARPIVLLKLGGSLITDKTREGVAHIGAIRRLAGEVGAAARRARGPRLLVGHGSGSYGHAAAAAGGLIPGVDARHRLEAIARTQDRAAELHRLVVSALLAADALPFSLSPSSFLLAADGHFREAFFDPIFAALERGLLPVLYGDVVLDGARGALIVSTETLFLLLAKEAARRDVRIARAGWLGVTDGVRSEDRRRIERLSAPAAMRAAMRVTGASGVDVTGGMALRLRTAAALATAGIPSLIVDGRRKGVIVSVITGRSSGGTRVDAR
jgi:isopentenyl phosphate kinase